MNIYTVCFIKSIEEDASNHIVFEIEADTSELAESLAREKARNNNVWLGDNWACSRELKHKHK